MNLLFLNNPLQATNYTRDSNFRRNGFGVALDGTPDFRAFAVQLSFDRL